MRTIQRIGRAAACAGWVMIALTPREVVATPSETSSTTAADVVSTQRVAISVGAEKFEPAEVHLVQGVPTILEFTRVTDEGTCTQAIRMPWMDKAVTLPLNEKVEISVDTSMTGVFSYSCWMNMVFGKVVIDKAD